MVSPLPRGVPRVGITPGSGSRRTPEQVVQGACHGATARLALDGAPSRHDLGWTSHLDHVRSFPLLALGIILVVLGAYIPLHLIWVRRPITGVIWLDLAFALVFLVRGYMNIRSARRPRPTPGANP